MKWGHIMKRFGMSCVRTVYFLRKSTVFHDMRTECQRILPTNYCWVNRSSANKQNISVRLLALDQIVWPLLGNRLDHRNDQEI